MSTDGEIELDALYLTPTSSPLGAHHRPLPTAVLIHGGPNTRVTNAFNAYYYMLNPVSTITRLRDFATELSWKQWTWVALRILLQRRAWHI